MNNSTRPRFGWHRDIPDPRDYTPGSPAARRLLEILDDRKAARGAGPPRVDWREYFGPADDERGLACCTAVAAVGLVGYFETRSTGRRIGGSARFLYAMARRLLRWKGDSGATLRATWKALARFGLPPDELYPDDGGASGLDDPPEPFLFCYQGPFDALAYQRLDPPGTSGGRTLGEVRAYLAAGFPCAFGFAAVDGLSDDPDIPFPTARDGVRGGQAALAVGYDDGRRIRSTRGAFLIRGSWGERWGERGYGWLPYAYVERQFAVDFWTLLKADWLESGEFSRPLPTSAA